MTHPSLGTAGDWVGRFEEGQVEKVMRVTKNCAGLCTARSKVARGPPTGCWRPQSQQVNPIPSPRANTANMSTLSCLQSQHVNLVPSLEASSQPHPQSQQVNPVPSPLSLSAQFQLPVSPVPVPRRSARPRILTPPPKNRSKMSIGEPKPGLLLLPRPPSFMALSPPRSYSARLWASDSTS